MILNKNINKYLKSLLYFFVPLLILSLIIHTFYYFDILSINIMKYLKIIIIIVSCLTSGFYIGLKSDKKGYLNGLFLSLIIVLIYIILSFILDKFKAMSLIYYLIIVVFITLGSMIGINRKRN